MLQKSFLDYYSRHEYPVLSTNEAFTRKLILDFKSGVEYSYKAFEELLAQYLYDTFGFDDMQSIYLMQVPAHSIGADVDRWCLFSHDMFFRYGIKSITSDVILSGNVGMTSHERRMALGYDDGERSNFWVLKPEKNINGRAFVIVDDIYTTGKSIQKVANYITEHGGNVIGYVTLAKTHTK